MNYFDLIHYWYGLNWRVEHSPIACSAYVTVRGEQCSCGHEKFLS